MKYIKCSVSTVNEKGDVINGLTFDEVDPKAIPAIVSLSRAGYRITLSFDEIEIEIGSNGQPIKAENA